MRLAVIGRAGQLARALVERAQAGDRYEIVTLVRPELDLANLEAGAAEALLAPLEVAAVINAAAYTAVDQAETDAAAALAINAHGPAALAAATARLGLPLLHLSTDYVFAGTQERPYTEDDPAAPATSYGRSKLAGERAVLAAADNAAVVRTSWVYSPFGHNFVRTMLRLAQDRPAIRVVADQIGNPTSALDLADALLAMAARLAGDPDPALRGLFHLAGSGTASWAELAALSVGVRADAGLPVPRIEPVTTADYPTPAPRPANSRLDCSRAALRHGVALPDWQTSARACAARILHQDHQGPDPS